MIRRLAQEIAAALAAGAGPLLVGHGSGSFGHVAAARAGLGSGLAVNRDGVSATQAEAAELHRMVVAALREAGARPFSFSPSSFLVAEKGQVKGTLPPALPVALDSGFLPVVYGDVVMDVEWGAAIASTEAVLAFLARELPAAGYRPRCAIWLGDTPGVLDAAGLPLPEIDPETWEMAVATIAGPPGVDVTGGMRLRVATAAELARAGVPSLLADGTVPGLLERALSGDRVPGTLIG